MLLHKVAPAKHQSGQNQKYIFFKHEILKKQKLKNDLEYSFCFYKQTIYCINFQL